MEEHTDSDTDDVIERNEIDNVIIIITYILHTIYISY